MSTLFLVLVLIFLLFVVVFCGMAVVSAMMPVMEKLIDLDMEPDFSVLEKLKKVLRTTVGVSAAMAMLSAWIFIVSVLVSKTLQMFAA